MYLGSNEDKDVDILNYNKHVKITQLRQELAQNKHPLVLQMNTESNLFLSFNLTVGKELLNINKIS